MDRVSRNPHDCTSNGMYSWTCTLQMWRCLHSHTSLSLCVQFFFRIETFSTWFTFGLHIHDWIFRHLFNLFISPCSCPFFSLLLNSLLSWLGDLFFLLQEPLTSSFNSKLKVSLPILKPKENSLLSADSAWQKAKHFSITALSILGSYFQVGVWTKNFDGKWKSYAYPVWKSILCEYVFSRAGDLRRPLIAYSGEKSNKCNQCECALFQKGNFQGHLKMHGGEKISIDNVTKHPHRNAFWEDILRRQRSG